LNIWGNNQEIVLEPSGSIARVNFDKVHDVYLNTTEGVDITVVKRQFGQLFIPPNIDKLGSHFIVSSLVLEAMRHFQKLEKYGVYSRFYCPDTGPTALRDINGNIQSVTRLVAL
tara:strand:+ start:7188 stop:7529 length:342 start_codon:yes stop_codon:yes gene_type:complete